MKRLDGKIAVVMGAGSIDKGWGNGKATAVTFAREGAHVVCVDANAEAAEETAAIIVRDGGSAIALRADVTREDDVAGVFSRVAKDHGRLDVLDNNVGLLGVGGVVDTSEDNWDLMMTANVTSAYLAMKYAVPLIQRAGGGSIVNISSLASIRYGGVPYVGYAVSKAALNHLTRVTAAEYAPQQIRVNAILPGMLTSPLVTTSADLAQACGDAWDVANAALFFAGDASRFVTGMELIVDGGMSLVSSPHIRPD